MIKNCLVPAVGRIRGLDADEHRLAAADNHAAGA
jgi:hypothetical protein